MVTATAGATLCRPSFTQGCYDEDGLASFTVNGSVLSQNTGCAPDGFSQYIALSTTLAAGQTVAIGGRFLGTTYPEGVTIWADLNRNSTFEANEQLYQTPVVLTSGFSGSITIPANTSAGALAIRVIVQYNGKPTNPCGTYNYGEAEEYIVQISTPCTALFTTQAGNWTDPSIWSCNRVPTATDPVEIRHLIAVPASTTVSALRVTYAQAGKITLGAAGRLQLGL